MNHHSIIPVLLVTLFFLFCSNGSDSNRPVPSVSAGTLTSQVVAEGFSSPVFLCSPPGDTTRLFIVEQAGRIRIIKDGTVLTPSFLDIDSRVRSAGTEQGLLGMAFHPDYAANGVFFVNYTAEPDGRTHVSRFQVSSDPDAAEIGSEEVILSVEQPFRNHNAGMLAFGPDGHLYIGLGDGGGGGDPSNNGQNPMVLLGKMLRVNVDSPGGYTIPASNPFVNSPDTLDEIWALGIRNPWRYSFDRQTGDLYMADVGQNAVEEIDFQTSTSGGGENYGWRLKEGSRCFNPPSGCEEGEVALVEPIYDYTHNDPGSPCSVTGGYVYRGCAVPEFDGVYFFADFCSGQVWSFRYQNDTLTEFQDHTADLVPGGANISSFGEDARGELYILDWSAGQVLKIVPNGSPAQCAADCCSGRSGNVTGDPFELVDILDLVYLVEYLFQSGPSPSCVAESNVSGDAEGSVDVADVLLLAEYLFSRGPEPALCVAVF